MKTRSNLWSSLCSFDNLFLAWQKARKRKTQKQYTIDFEKEILGNLLKLQSELETGIYTPKPLINFTIRDPKTRKISKSDFRDRIIHHALCNIIEPIFDKTFIYDTYANRLGKGSLKAVQRFEYFKNMVSKNSKRTCYVLKADIKHYFYTVDHKILLNLLKRKIADEKVLFLIKIILNNHVTEIEDKGMPLGNLTSQFFANIYLSELDHYAKETMQVKYYIRYVDDFVILSSSEKQLSDYREKINEFLITKLCLKLHPEKTRIIPMHRGVGFLGLRIFENHRLLKKSNIRKFKNKISKLCTQYDNKEIDYDKIYDAIEGWVAYTKTANTYKLRNELLKQVADKFGGEISTKEYNRYLKTQKSKKIKKKH